ncbi:MAG: hypothetical protein QHH13_00230 [Melioribacter sp.]|uniref:[protein-PII] uridylyltransferase family protein n=1 Tax=Rosettibacter primus TaxID=3111523 RepID=UPI00247F0DAB|nr:hypothetical protein [Melioribacter sp.]
MIEFTQGLISSDVFDKALRVMELEAGKYHFSSSSEANLLRIFNSLYDKHTFFHELVRYPHHAEILIAITASSNYLTDIVVRNPEYLYQVFDQEYLALNISSESLTKELQNGINRYSTFNAKLNFIRQFKKRYILKIGVNDILYLSDLKTITEQLSYLANSILSVLFELCYQETLLKYDLKTCREYCLCSLGKLGGNELNYSSDVDLILFYDENEYIKEIKKEYHEILSEAALLFIKSSTEITDRGYIYRIDFRLRPDGKYSPLCKAYSDYTKYYETRGEDWERQMLIKLNYVCGNYNLYQKFYQFLQPYIFPASFSTSLKEQIKKMKYNIELHNREKENVKLFQGGIRDIEFTVQALQLLNGGRFKELRTGNTLKAIELLYEKNLLKQDEKDLLIKAYIFYRRIEHFLQLMNDTQTHLIPSEGELLYKLCSYLRYDDEKKFQKELSEIRKRVRNIYNNILGGDDKNEKIDLGKIHFKDYNRAEKNLKYLRSGLGYFEQKEFDSKTIELFNHIEPELIKYLEKCSSPDVTLDNFVKVIRASKFPSIWYSEFLNKHYFKSFLKVCEFCSKAVDILILDKSVEEIFLSHDILIKNVEDYISNYKINQIIFLLSVQYTLGLISTEKISSLICKYVDLRISKLSSQYNSKYNYFIGGLGSYGSYMLNFSSDIDLIIITDNVNKYSEIQDDFQKLLKLLQNELKPFDIDVRLRPEGKSSPLVWGVESYKNYLQTRARIWEFQSLSKIRFISGNQNLFKKFKSILINHIKSLDMTYVTKEMLHMYRLIMKENISHYDSTFNIKKQNGGLVTIDFLIQSQFFNNPRLQGKKTINIIKNLKKIFPKEDYELILDNYLFLRKIEFALQCIFNTTSAIFPATEERKSMVASFFKITTEELQKKLSSVIKSNILLFEKYVGKI